MKMEVVAVLLGCLMASARSGTKELEECPEGRFVRSCIALGKLSGVVDEDESLAVCPEGSVLSSCSKAEGSSIFVNSDGVRLKPGEVDEEKRSCVARKSLVASTDSAADVVGVQARAECRGIQKFPNQISGSLEKDPVLLYRYATVKNTNKRLVCPEGYEQEQCLAWSGTAIETFRETHDNRKVLSANGTISNSHECKLNCSWEKNKKCIVSIICRFSWKQYLEKNCLE